jgi:hypothetical protein
MQIIQTLQVLGLVKDCYQGFDVVLDMSWSTQGKDGTAHLCENMLHRPLPPRS